MCAALLGFLPDRWFARVPGLRLADDERVG
jgi:hypothetical protein